MDVFLMFFLRVLYFHVRILSHPNHNSPIDIIFTGVLNINVTVIITHQMKIYGEIKVHSSRNKSVKRYKLMNLKQLYLNSEPHYCFSSTPADGVPSEYPLNKSKFSFQYFFLIAWTRLGCHIFTLDIY